MGCYYTKQGEVAMKKEAYIIRGKIIDSITGTGIPGLRIEAWDKDLITDDLLDTKVTDEQGAFEMKFTSAQFQERFLDRKPDLLFKVYHNNEEIHSTRNKVMWNYDKADEEIIIPIDWKFEEHYIVSGYVRTEDNRPVPDILVIAFDRKVGKDTPLGESNTKDGFYRIDYTGKADGFQKNLNADLFVQAYSSDESDKKVIARSDLMVDAPKNARINLTVPNDAYRGPSEFEKLNSAITKLLKPAGLKDLKPRDIEYIAAKLKLALPKVARFVHAWKLMWTAGEYKKDHNIPAEAFYGVIQDDDLTELTILINQNKQSLKQLLELAVKSNIISIELKEQIDSFVDAFKEIAVAIAEEEPDN